MFICNAFNCLNKENKGYQIISLYLIFFLSSLGFYLWTWFLCGNATTADSSAI
jgi:hypothetical protein